MDTVLFVCTHNAARSQLAEALLNARHGRRFRAYSAGTAPDQVHPLAIEVLEELGIDVAHHRSKHVDELAGQSFDFVVTVCDNAREACPYVPARKENLHRGFPDPSAVAGSTDERRAAFRSARDDIAGWLDATFGSVGD